MALVISHSTFHANIVAESFAERIACCGGCLNALSILDGIPDVALSASSVYLIEGSAGWVDKDTDSVGVEIGSGRTSDTDVVLEFFAVGVDFGLVGFDAVALEIEGVTRIAGGAFLLDCVEVAAGGGDLLAVAVGSEVEADRALDAEVVLELRAAGIDGCRFLLHALVPHV